MPLLLPPHTIRPVPPQSGGLRRPSLIPAEPAVYGDNLNIYEGRKLAAFDMDKLIYFGMSVFWRGACREWRSSNGAVAPAVDLGPYYEPIREFLLGAPLPDSAHLVVLINNFKPVGNAAVTVQRGKSGYGDFYWLYINGLGFMLYLGEGFPKNAEIQCAQHGPNGPIVVDRAFTHMAYAFLRELLEESKKSGSVVDLLQGPTIGSSDIEKKLQS